jgi:ureidoglycolate hydrolase
MNEKLLEIREFTGSGYQPVIDYADWRVAILNYIDDIHPERIELLERHNETDEVFVLMKGKCILFLGEGEMLIENIYAQVMEPGKIYNVKKGIWHSAVLSINGSVLIVENRNTTEENSDYSALDLNQRKLIIEISREQIRD